MHRRIAADLALLVVAIIWGATFVVVKRAVAEIPPFEFLAIRFFLASVSLVCLYPRALRRLERRSIVAGAVIGIFLFAGYAFQTVGLQYTSASKAAFITGLAVALVPIFSTLALRRPPSVPAIIGVALAMVGLGLLTLSGPFLMARGDFLVALCAVSFALQIVSVGHFAARMDPAPVVITQLAFVCLASAAAFLAAESPGTPVSPVAWFGIVTTAIPATSFAFMVQNTAQKFTTPTHTALIFSVEPVAAAAFGRWLLGETLSPRGLLGCALVLAGMIIAETVGPGFNSRARPSEPHPCGRQTRTQAACGCSPESPPGPSCCRAGGSSS